VVSPLFFPGGDIGDLAVNGTVNDLAMCGARPLYLSCGFILEEGFPVEDLQRIVASMAAAAKAAGVQITCEASPHHLTLTHEALAEQLDTRLKMNPPLREEDDRQALIAGLIDGTVDCIATDHAPHARDEKEVPFEEAPMGTTGLETAFAAVHTHLVIPGLISLELAIGKLTAGCGLLGLPIPRIATGAVANLALLDLEVEWEVGEDGYESKSENCCFAGTRLRGRPLLTIAAGSVAFRTAALEAVAA